MNKKKTSVVIDPVAMNIINKISKGSVQKGEVHYKGGVLVEGTFTGKMTIDGGPLVVADGGILKGDIEVMSDAYFFGALENQDDFKSTLRVHGELHLTSKCVIWGSVFFNKLATYHGAKISGSMQSIDNTTMS